MKHKDSQAQPRAFLRRSGHLLRSIRAILGIDLFRFRGKTVLITGGSRGLGLILARKLAMKGAKLAIVARDDEELARAKKDLEQRGATVVALKCDVREASQIKSMVQAVTSKLGPIEVLINNAGIITVGPLDVMTPEDFEDAMKTHFWGALQTTLAVLPGMRELGRGRIVNISSIAGQIPAPHMLPYVASKFALTGLSQGLRAELLKDGIVVTTVCPGLMRTGSAFNAFFKGKHRAEFAWFMMVASSPLTSMNADRAARIILRAVRHGRAQITVTNQAKIAAKIMGLIPGLMTDRMGIIDRFLPEPNGIGDQKAKGFDSQSPLTQSFLTILTQLAAKKNNELP